jgi:metallo-beta-lactamase family protein
METTYADRAHKPIGPSVAELYQAVSETFERGGNVIIPTFALERAQELLFYLREGVQQRRLPRLLQVFLDSPMAISATAIFERHPAFYAPGVAELLRQGHDPFHMPGLHFTREAADSMAINRITGGAVIMAGSGMCTGGRVRHHLRHNLAREHCAVVFVGFAAAGTLARQIIDGASTVHIFGEDVAVRARIHTIGGFSAHADQKELLAWRATAHAKRTFLVHGDESAMRALAPLLRDTHVEMPATHQAFDL